MARSRLPPAVTVWCVFVVLLAHAAPPGADGQYAKRCALNSVPADKDDTWARGLDPTVSLALAVSAWFLPPPLVLLGGTAVRDGFVLVSGSDNASVVTLHGLSAGLFEQWTSDVQSPTQSSWYCFRGGLTITADPRGELVVLRQNGACPPPSLAMMNATDGSLLWGWHAQQPEVNAVNELAFLPLSSGACGEAGSVLLRLSTRDWPLFVNASLELRCASTGKLLWFRKQTSLPCANWVIPLWVRHNAVTPAPADGGDWRDLVLCYSAVQYSSDPPVLTAVRLLPSGPSEVWSFRSEYSDVFSEWTACGVDASAGILLCGATKEQRLWAGTGVPLSSATDSVVCLYDDGVRGVLATAPQDGRLRCFLDTVTGPLNVRVPHLSSPTPWLEMNAVVATGGWLVGQDHWATAHALVFSSDGRGIAASSIRADAAAGALVDATQDPVDAYNDFRLDHFGWPVVGHGDVLFTGTDRDTGAVRLLHYTPPPSRLMLWLSIVLNAVKSVGLLPVLVELLPIVFGALKHGGRGLLPRRRAPQQHFQFDYRQHFKLPKPEAPERSLAEKAYHMRGHWFFRWVEPVLTLLSLLALTALAARTQLHALAEVSEHSFGVQSVQQYRAQYLAPCTPSAPAQLADLCFCGPRGGLCVDMRCDAPLNYTPLACETVRSQGCMCDQSLFVTQCNCTPAMRHGAPCVIGNLSTSSTPVADVQARVSSCSAHYSSIQRLLVAQVVCQLGFAAAMAGLVVWRLWWQILLRVDFRKRPQGASESAPMLSPVRAPSPPGVNNMGRPCGARVRAMRVLDRALSALALSTTLALSIWLMVLAGTRMPCAEQQGLSDPSTFAAGCAMRRGSGFVRAEYAATMAVDAAFVFFVSKPVYLFMHAVQRMTG